MSMRMPILSVVGLAIAACCADSAMAAQVLKKEPAMGQLQEGQVVLVDDGTCPAGRIKQVTGGNHVKAGGRKYIERQRKCVPR
jgi:hypothetical protein